MKHMWTPEQLLGTTAVSCLTDHDKGGKVMLEPKQHQLLLNDAHNRENKQF